MKTPNEINVKPETKKFCFSYIRFSSKRQELGSSLERQAPIAPRVAKEKRWIYEPKFNAKNLGVSAYKGDNKKTLEAICQAAIDGKIPKGSVMILEALDRATRLQLDEAYQLLRQILLSGLEIYTDTNHRHLTALSLNDVTSVMLTAVELDAAFQYAKRLSNRSHGGINKKIAAMLKGEKVYFGGSMPSYLVGVKDGEWIVDEKRVETIQRIFADYISGKSMTGIAIELNEDNAKGIKYKNIVWRQGTIHSILTNAAYSGDFTFKGKTYSDYLLPIVSKEDFERVKNIMVKNSRRKGGSSSGKINSIFNGIARCVYCEAGMTAITSKYKNVVHSYYGCQAARFNKCISKGHWFNTADCEEYFILEFLNETPFGLIKKNTPKAVDNSSSIKAKIAAIDNTISEAVELLGSGMAVSKIKAKIATMEADKATLQNELQLISNRLLAANDAPAIIGQMKSALEMMDNLDNFAEVQNHLADNEVRKKLKSLIPLLVKEVRFDVIKGGFSVIDHNDKQSEFVQVNYNKTVKAS